MNLAKTVVHALTPKTQPSNSPAIAETLEDGVDTDATSHQSITAYLPPISVANSENALPLPIQLVVPMDTPNASAFLVTLDPDVMSLPLSVLETSPSTKNVKPVNFSLTRTIV